VLPEIYPRRNILATNGKELHQIVNKIAYNYFNRLRKKKKEGNKMGTFRNSIIYIVMYVAWIQICDLEHPIY
jgi:hypothetical protein